MPPPATETAPAPDTATGTSERSLVSVVVAVLDAEEVLPRQLAALAAQVDPGPWELVVADNGSTDGTVGVVEAFAREHPQVPVRVVSATQRKGAGAARNAGVAAARGRWVAFCDADDVVVPGWLRSLREALAEHRYVVGSLSSDGLNDDWLRRSRPLDQVDALQPGPCSPFLPHAGAGNMAVEKALFESVGGFDPACRHLEDTDLSWRLQLVGGVEPVLVQPAAVQVQLRSSLRGMVRQGLSYGVGTSWLRARYRRVPPAPAAGADGAAGSGGAESRPWWRPAGPLDRGALGFVLWQLSWRVGNRIGGLVLRVRREVPEPLTVQGRR